MHNLDFQATTYPNGKFESQAMCNEDKTDGFRVRWYESGQMKSATEYKHGKPDGLLTAWHENGNKSAEINYLDGHRHGVCTLWHKDGSKRSEVVYVNGRMNKLWVTWHSTGSIRKAVLFKDKGCRKKSETTWYDNGSIKSNIEFGDEYSNRAHIKFADVSYGDWADFYAPHPSGFEFDLNGSDFAKGGKRYPTQMTFWYKNGKKSSEHLNYGYESSVIFWYENGQKSMEVGKEKGNPDIYWDKQGVKEYETTLDFDLIDVDVLETWLFFDENEHFLAVVKRAEIWDKFVKWEFYNKDNEKVYDYKHDYSKDAFLTTDKLWNIWLNSECIEFTKTLKSIEKHKSVFCQITNYD